MTVTATTPPSTHPPNLAHKLPPLLPRPRQQRAAQSSAPAEPPPATPVLPSPLPAAQLGPFCVPARCILSAHDLDLFVRSPTYQLVLAFVFGLSDSARETTIGQALAREQSELVKSILEILDQALQLVESNPPLDTGSRFGNPAFRTYVEAVSSRSMQWHENLKVPHDAFAETSSYLEHSFGSASRIDYGSGHELNFFLWLLCLNRLSLLSQIDFPSLALVVFPRYLKLMRAVQSTYYLEPAGSHGVWGLDDYQFLPFLFGAAQLVHHRYITPKSIHSQPTIEECSKDYLYFNQVAFVNSVKNVEGLRWHSPMLDDISAAKSWEKIEAGMKKMFVKEVLGKLPVMQHFLFGSLISAAEGMSKDADELEAPHDHEHEHGENSWDDCCGIKVPSSLGAAGEMKRGGGERLRRLPFD